MSNVTTLSDALWLAINTNINTKDEFKRKIRYDGKGALNKQWTPVAGEMPAIEIEPTGGQDNWVSNMAHRRYIDFQVSIWTQAWAFEQAMDLFEKVKVAIWGETDPTHSPRKCWQANGFCQNIMVAQSWSTGRVTDANGNTHRRTTFGVKMEIHANPRTGV